MVAMDGYDFVEAHSALFNRKLDIDALGQTLSETGLKMPIAHFSLPMLQADPNWVIKTCRRLGIKTVVMPDLAQPLRPRTRDGWRSFGHLLAEAAAPLQAAGLGFAYHNHGFEFERLSTGEYPLEIIMSIDPKIRLELDLAWVLKAGENPAQWLKRFSDQIVALHIKDLAAAGANLNEEGWADVGHGIVNWETLWPLVTACKTAYKIVAHEQPADHWRFSERAIASVQRFDKGDFS